ncbi:uncharacterized protein HD556DRAFT_1314538 [Suillus plorans]|uniref:DUF6589 domain-containing protein n=1 Tax=Suillus plorans TaxID=116603 RepID=A0A9P7ABH3_9AGAM|nr:uncharacterized protein HD556DRAFT_1314538 [Suillus plorans]KAG1785090.1 hypothetical protein HD556DRAFT_1314538 [Suillus plorans]
MDVNNSTVSGNIRAVVEILTQGGIYDPDADILDNPDISQHIILIHGDLGTGERLQSAQLRQSLEATLWNRFQHVIFIPGLFHLKMACADAIWRTFLQPLVAQEDETSLMHDVMQLRPKETGTYCSKPGFRLEAFTASELTFDELKAIANEIALKYVATHKLLQMRQTSIIAWILILKATGKHKYATHMTNFLINMHFVFPAGLKHAVKNGGKGSNRTVDRIFLESPLVEAYRNTQVMVQKNFLHAHLTTSHVLANMIKTFEGLIMKMAAQSPHTVVLGRKTCCEIPDLIDKGRDMMEKAAHGEGNDEPNVEMDDREEGAEMEDVLMEV